MFKKEFRLEISNINMNEYYDKFNREIEVFKNNNNIDFIQNKVNSISDNLIISIRNNENINIQEIHKNFIDYLDLDLHISELHSDIKKPAIKFLYQLLVKNISEKVSKEFNLWKKMFNIVTDIEWSLYEDFINNLNNDDIKKNLTNIKQVLKYEHPLELIHYPINKSDWSTFDESEISNEEKSIDSWKLTEIIEHHSYDSIITEKLKMVSEFIIRVGINEWIQWVDSFNSLIVKKTLINEIQSFDDCIKITNEVLRLKKLANKELILTLLIRRGLMILKKINYTLNYNIYNNSILLKKYNTIERKKELENWSNNELPSLLDTFIELLIKKQKSMQVLIYSLRHIYIREHEEEIINELFRKTIIKQLCKNKISISNLIDIIFEHKNEESSLISSLLIIGEYVDNNDREIKEAERLKIWNYYCELLKNKKLFWTIPIKLESDMFLNLWLTSRLLVTISKPLNKLKDLLDSININSEGWKNDSRNYYDSIPNVCHCLIIGSMSCEWLTNSGYNKKSKLIFNYVWNFTHNWIRKIYFYPDNIYSIFPQLWSRLKLVNPKSYNDIALKTLELFDDIELMILSVQNLSNNLGNDTLNEKFKIKLVKKFKDNYEVFRFSKKNELDKIKPYEDFIEKISKSF